MTFLSHLLRDCPNREIGLVTLDNRYYPLFNYQDPNYFDYWIDKETAFLYHGNYIIGIIDSASWQNTPYTEKIYFAATPLLRAVTDSAHIILDENADEKYTGIIYLDQLAH